MFCLENKSVCKGGFVFIMITGIFWRTFWRDNWQSLIGVLENFCYREHLICTCFTNIVFQKNLEIDVPLQTSKVLQIETTLLAMSYNWWVLKSLVFTCWRKIRMIKKLIVGESAYTPARTLFISGLKSWVLKLPFFT